MMSSCLGWHYAIIAIMPSCHHVNRVKGATTGGRGLGSPKIFIDPQFWTELLTRGVGLTRPSEMFFYVLLEKSIFSKFHFQLYTKLNDLKFKIPKKFWGGAHRTPPQTPPPLFLEFRPIRTPQLLKLGCALESCRHVIISSCHPSQHYLEP